MGTWMNPDGLFKKFGTTKATPNTGGEYKTYGEFREIELRIDLTTLTASPVIQNDEVFYPIGMRLQEVEVYVETAAVGGTSFSLGLVQTDRSTVISNTFFLAATVIADHDVTGEKKAYSGGIATFGVGAGTPNTVPGYITALAAGTYSAGVVKVRIRYIKLNTN
jgi:hypothetical protein